MSAALDPEGDWEQQLAVNILNYLVHHQIAALFFSRYKALYNHNIKYILYLKIFKIYFIIYSMKKPISATIDEELIKWIEHEVHDRYRYRNKSHLIEIALDLLRKRGPK